MGRYKLIVTEKPDAAQRIAVALDLKGKPERMEERGVPYYIAQRDSQIVVVPALGHLYTVAAENDARNRYPVFNFKWVPRYVAERNAKRIRTWIETIAKLAEDADSFIDACDYDVEGSVIGYCILKYACGNKEQASRRMKYSTLTKEELEKSYEKPLQHLDFALIEAGITRHEIDWLYGINLSRALSTAAKNWSGKYTILSTGRVQGPTLKFAATRESTVKTFVPTPYWQIKARILINGTVYEAEYEKRKIETKKEAESIQSESKNKDGQVENAETKEYQQHPPPPFDLGALQNEAYRLFGYSPKNTSSIAQRLYLDALISYPRTSSQKLPPTIDSGSILRNLNRAPEYRKPTSDLLAKPYLKPKEGKKEDSAHPAIYPTGSLPERPLESNERRIWNLVIRRFMAVFGEPARKQTVKICINISGHSFYLKGNQILEPGWLSFYGHFAQSKELILPPLSKGQTLKVQRLVLEDKFTQPPPRYNPSSLLRKMEEQEIGTKATRADTIQTLYSRKYVQGKRITPTDLGFQVIKTLGKYCPAVISTTMTRELEGKMNKIQETKEKRQNVLKEAIETLESIVDKLKENEKAIGEQLSEAIEKSRMEERIIDTCPVCKTGKLVIVYSRRTGKRFAGCTNYFKGLCQTSAPLPQRGNIKLPGRNCRGCSWPTVRIWRGRRSWTLCLNPKCPLKEQRTEKLEVQDML